MAAKRQAQSTVYRVTYVGEMGKRKHKVFKATEWATSEAAGESQVLMFADNDRPVFGIPLASFLELEEVTDVAELLELSIDARLPKSPRQGSKPNKTTPDTTD